MNPLANITSKIDPAVLHSVADRVGIPDTAVKGVLDVLGPELMQGMFAKLKSGGAGELIAILKNDNALASGDDMLERILEGNLNAVLESVAQRAGISVSQARVVASALAPALIEALGKMGTVDPKMVAKAMGIAKLMGIKIPGADAIGGGVPGQAQEKKKSWLGGLLGR